MASEPNNPGAEEQLKRYAQERRKDAPGAIHPATRRMLQGEVTRVYGTRDESASAGWRRWMVTPSFAWGVACVAMLGISIFVLQRPIPQKTVEDTAAPPAEAPKLVEQAEVRPPASANAPAREETVLLKEEKRMAAKPEAVVSPTVQPPPTMPAPKSKAAESAGASTEIRQVAREDNFRRREVLSTPAPAGPVVTLNDEAISEKELDSIQFSNLAAVTAETAKKDAVSRAAAPAQQQVLTRFQMLQRGNKMQIVDADRSVYPGVVVAQRDGTNSFRAEGTNQTLRQSVVVTGQYFRARAPYQLSQPQNRPQQQQNAITQDGYRVQGNAVVGRNTQVPIDAQVTQQQGR